MPRFQLIFFVILSNPLFAQQEQKGFIACGGNVQSAMGSFSYSVGQIDYQINQSNGGTSWEGLQIPVEFLSLDLNDIAWIKNIKVFPNPTINNIFIDLQDSPWESRSILLHDSNGKLLLNQRLTDKINIIPLETFEAGSYHVELMHNNHVMGSFKVIKVN